MLGPKYSNRSEVFKAAVGVNMSVFCNVTSRSLLEMYRRFEGVICRPSSIQTAGSRFETSANFLQKLQSVTFQKLVTFVTVVVRPGVLKLCWSATHYFAMRNNAAHP